MTEHGSGRRRSVRPTRADTADATLPKPAAAVVPRASAIDPTGRRRQGRRPARRSTRAGDSHVTIVVPAKNEEGTIGRTLRALPTATLAAMGFSTDVVVLDGHSSDGTAAIGRAYGATIVPDAKPGKGAAFRLARHHFRGRFVVMLDADGTYAADAIPGVVAHLAWGSADVVMGTRRAQDGAMTGLHRLGNYLLSAGASVLYGRNCPDVCTGLWGFRADALRRLPLRSNGFELEAELFALAARLGLEVAHVDVDYLARPPGSATKLNAGRDGLRIGWWLLRSRFSPLGAPTVGPSPGALGASGAGVAAGLAAMGRALPASASTPVSERLSGSLESPVSSEGTP